MKTSSWYWATELVIKSCTDKNELVISVWQNEEIDANDHKISHQAFKWSMRLFEENFLMLYFGIDSTNYEITLLNAPNVE